MPPLPGVPIAPLHRTALLAKQAATLHEISGGRFTLGIGLGGFADDYVVAGVDRRTRGTHLDVQMSELHQLWAAGTVASPGRPEVLFGGFAPAVLERVGRWGDGFLGAFLPPAQMPALFDRVADAWHRAGRGGAPRLVVQVNAAAGPPEVVADARGALSAYYGPIPHLPQILDALVTTPAAVRAVAAECAAIGADELMLYCWAADPAQVERIAAALR